MSKGPVTGLPMECCGATEHTGVLSLLLLLCMSYNITYINMHIIEFVLPVHLFKNFLLLPLRNLKWAAGGSR